MYLGEIVKYSNINPVKPHNITYNITCKLNLCWWIKDISEQKVIDPKLDGTRCYQSVI